MKLTSTTFDFCEKVGLLKENFTREAMFNKLVSEISRHKADIDNDFIKAVSKLSPDTIKVDNRVAVMYHYDINVTYKINGREKQDRIGGFGNTGTPDSLKVTNYYKDGDYTVIKNKDASVITTSTWNDKNIFTFEEIKSALKGVIEKNLPSNWQSYSSSDWTVSAFIAPIYTFDVEFKGKTYVLSANLHNGCISYDFPKNYKLEKKAKSAKVLSKFALIVAIILAAVGVFSNISNGISSAILPLAVAAFDVLIFAKHNTSVYDIKRKMSKKNRQSIMLVMIPEDIALFLSLIVFIMR